MNILVTGGAGYIGSHAAMRLIEDGHAVTVVDSLVRGKLGAIDALRREARGERLHFARADVGDRDTMTRLLRERSIDAVMHFAALAYVGESVNEPLRYYRNNAAGALGLIEAMNDAGVTRLVFSSTCSTYGEPSPEFIPIPETCPQRPVNPYGRSKLMVEQMLFDHAAAASAEGRDFAFATLRYFNVAGCDRAGRLGEDHRPETHLIPLALDAALGRVERLTIFGTDYDTPDGTCVRDYIHVDDLIDAHVVVLEALQPGETRAYNLGIGKGSSVREVIDACRRVSGVEFEVAEGARRPGDPPRLFADPSRIQRELGWTASVTDLDEMIDTAWRWRKANPGGYPG